MLHLESIGGGRPCSNALVRINKIGLCNSLTNTLQMEIFKMDLIQETVFRVIRKVTGSVLDIEMDSALSDMRVNSVKIIQIIAMLENELDFELDEEDLLMSNFSTPRKTINLLREKYSAVELA